MLNIEPILKKLSEDRPIFHSEADFQHALAWEIHKKYPKVSIRLEISSDRPDKRERIDILIRNKNEICAIELKYKKTEINIIHNKELFNLRPDIAQDISRYDFIKDITRLERYVGSHPKSIGYAIILTNDDLYWRDGIRGINSKDFFLNEGRILKKEKKMDWHSNTGNGTKKGREKPLELQRDYHLHWKEYSTINELPKKNKFHYLLLKVI